MMVLPEDFIILCFIIPWWVASLTSASTFYLNQQSCTGRNDCDAIKNSHCKLLTPSCGVCTCLTGYVLYIPEDFSPMECRRAVYLDDPCYPDGPTACSGANVECSVKLRRCICKNGYKRGLIGNDCIPFVMDKAAGELCYDDMQCYYTLDCINFSCGCQTPYMTMEHNCQARSVHDQCTSDENCRQVPNTLCRFKFTNVGTCECADGFKTVQYSLVQSAAPQKDYVTTKTACVPNNDLLRGEGETCSPSQENINKRNTNSIYCKSPFVCNSCAYDGVFTSQCVNLTKLDQVTAELDSTPLKQLPSLSKQSLTSTSSQHYYRKKAQITPEAEPASSSYSSSSGASNNRFNNILIIHNSSSAVIILLLILTSSILIIIELF